MSTVVDRLVNRPRRTATHRLYLDPNQADAIREAEQRVQVAELLLRPEDPTTATELAEAKALLETARDGADVVEFHLQAVGAEVVDRLMVDCEPTKDQKAAATRLGKPAPTYDGDELYVQLLAQAITGVLIVGGDEAASGPLTVDQVRDLWKSKTWPREDLVDLGNKAMDLNQVGTAVGRLGNG